MASNAFPARPSIHLVARLLSPAAQLVTLDDGAVVLDAGLFVYTLDPTSAPRRLGEAAAYAPLLRQDESGGHAHAMDARSITGTTAKLELVQPEAGLFAWDGKWTFSPKDPLGPEMLLRQLRSTRAAPVPDLLTERDSCVGLPSADANGTWVGCRRAGGGPREIFVRRRGTWSPISLAGEGEHEEPAAVARDGSLWLGSHQPERDTQIVRLRDGRLDRLGVPDQVGPRRASYRGTSRPQVVTNPEPVAARQVRAMAAARDGTMWVLATGPTGDALYRAGGERPANVALIGSVLDQRAEVEGALPRRRWVGHCDTVFVPVVRGHGEAFPIEKLRDPGRRAALSSASAIVIGWLGNERVAGPLFTGADDDGRERMIERLVASLAENPAAMPEPTCTLPVLERTFDL